MHDIGRCLIEINILTNAKVCLAKALKIKQQASSNIAIDKEVAVTSAKIDRCLIELNVMLRNILKLDQKLNN